MKRPLNKMLVYFDSGQQILEADLGSKESSRWVPEARALKAEAAVLEYPEWPCPCGGHTEVFADGMRHHRPDCLRAELEARK